MSKPFMAFSNVQTQNLEQLIAFSLPCPRTGEQNVYFTDAEQGGNLYEIQKVAGVGRKACWLIDHALYNDGTMKLISIVDPLFVALPILERARGQMAESEGKFRTLDDIFSIENLGVPENDYTPAMEPHRLIELNGFKDQLAHLCDVQEIVDNIRVYRLNNDKVLEWLQKKVNRLLPKFESIPALSDAVAADTDPSKSLSEKDRQDTLREEAIYLYGKYLSAEWFKKLLECFNLDEIKTEQEIGGDITNYFTSSPSVYLNAAASKATADESSAKKARKAEVPRSLRNVNTRGIRSLTSFFKKQ